MTLRELELKIAAGTATIEDFQAFEAADVHRIKSTLPVLYRAAAPLAVNDLVDVASITVPANPEERVIELVANAQLVDRMGDLIVSSPADCEKYGGKGWEMTNFMAAGGPYLWSHDPRLPAVGKVVGHEVKRVPVQVEGEGEKRVWALVCRVQFFADDRFGPLAVPAYMLTRAGITASSVGFLPKVYHRIEDEKERGKLGLGPWGAVLPWNELLELSKAQVPANPWSVGTGKAAGESEKRIVDTLKRWVAEGKLAESLAGDFVRTFPLGERDAAERLAAKVRGFLPAAAAAGKACEGLACLDMPADETAPPPCSCGAKATRDMDLDAAREEIIALRSERETIRDLIGAPLGDDLIGPLTKALQKADEEIPARSMKRIRRALERASEAVEDLAIVVDEEAGEDAGGEKAAGRNSPDLQAQLSALPDSMAADLSVVLADHGRKELVAQLLRALVDAPSGGGSCATRAVAARGAAGSDAGQAVAALQQFHRELTGAAS